jgi:hypothetical protein
MAFFALRLSSIYGPKAYSRSSVETNKTASKPDASASNPGIALPDAEDLILISRLGVVRHERGH